MIGISGYCICDALQVLAPFVVSVVKVLSGQFCQSIRRHE